MKHFLYALIPVLLFALNVSAQQDNYKRHKVAKSETVTQIAKKYKVTPFDIYRLNPDSQNGIKEDQVLLIPSSGNGVATAPPVSAPVASAQSHLVQPKETLFSIARDYNVSVKDLQSVNAAILIDGLKSGQTIRIPGGSVISTPITRPTTVVELPMPSPSAASQFHVVEPGQTKFSIAKKYGMTVAELERKNPAVSANLPIGYRLVVNGSAAEPVTLPTGSVTSTITPTTKIAYANYEVKPKETMYSLSQMFSITAEELIALNPSLKDGVKVGMILKVPGRGSIIMQVPGFKDLAATRDSKQRKELVMLLPFNASKIQGDSVTSITERLKKDQFLNMTLDFYSGALMAIDSAKTLGLNVNVRIFDSAESKYSSGVTGIIQSNNLQKADAVIGPFYQQYLETTAELLAKDSVAVISPLSRDSGKPIHNLYQTMPTENALKSAMFNYMLGKNGNIIVVSDPKKAANREFITNNYKQAKFVQLSETGALVSENLRNMLVKDKINYVVLDSERTGMILATTNVLLNEVNNYQIQLAIIEQNATLDFEEISLKRLTLLKMLYPSVTRDNNTAEASAFANAYREKNKIFPSQYATRGFDVTFDTLLRLSQGKSYKQTVEEDKSEQVESRFNYSKDKDGGYVNKGIYILQYNDDLSISEVN